jgi:hypothetical protein
MSTSTTKIFFNLVWLMLIIYFMGLNCRVAPEKDDRYPSIIDGGKEKDQDFIIKDGGNSPFLDGGEEIGEGLTIAEVVDPKLEKVPIFYSLEEDGSVKIRILKGEKELISFTEKGKKGKILWDGKDANGAYVPVGKYDVELWAGDDSEIFFKDKAIIHVIRIGVIKITFSDSKDGKIYKLAYHKGGKLISSPQWTIKNLDLPDGSPRPYPDPWHDLNSPPKTNEDINLPIAYQKGKTLGIKLQLAAENNSGYPLAHYPIRVIIKDAICLSDNNEEGVSPGQTLIFETTKPLPNIIGKNNLSLYIQYQYWKEGKWRKIGNQKTSHIVYTLNDKPNLNPDGESEEYPHVSWVSVLEKTSSWLKNETNCHQVMTKIVEHVYSNLGLTYIAGGAYVTQPGPKFSFDLSRFLEDWDKGSFKKVACLDIAALVATLSNMFGCQSGTFLLKGLTALNKYLLIGRDRWSSGSFYLHMIVSPDKGKTIYDATLMLDSDDDPSKAPYKPIYVTGIPFSKYEEMFSRALKGSLKFQDNHIDRKPKLY